MAEEDDIEQVPFAYDDDDSDDDLQDLYESFFSLDESLDATSCTEGGRSRPYPDENTVPSVPLYNGACLTTIQAQFLIYQFVLRHSLSNKVSLNFCNYYQFCYHERPICRKLLTVSKNFL